MKTTNLILTSTAGMSREQWLAFRKPINHVTKFCFDLIEKKLGKEERPAGLFRSEKIYKQFKACFNSPEWKKFIFPTLGASEMSPVLGLNPYKSKIELYYEKIGVKDMFTEDNAAMFWGRELEEQIAQKWQYWDGAPEGMILNFNSNNIIRKCRRLNSYVQNKLCPWIFASLDRLINQQKNVEVQVDEGSLECKTISGFAANMWEHGIPPMYVVQLQTQLIAAILLFGEMAILKDGKFFEVYPFDKHDKMCERITRDSQKFFLNVKAGIEHFLLSLTTTDEVTQQNHVAGYDQYAPEPDGSEAYKDYLSERYKVSIEGLELQGSPADSELAREYTFLNGRMKELGFIQTECANKIKAVMKDASVMSLEDGKATWRKGGKSRTFRVNIKLPEGYVPDRFKTNPGAIIETNVVAHSKAERVKAKPKKTPKAVVKKKPVKLVSNKPFISREEGSRIRAKAKSTGKSQKKQAKVK